MNFGKSALKARPAGNARAAEHGNAMIYVLLALALIGILTATLVSQDSTGGDDLSQDQVQFQMNEILTYAADAQAAVDRLIMGGVDSGSIDFVLPNASSFNTAPNFNKLYHPQGGGLNYKPPTIPPFVDSGTGNTEEGWYITRRNIGWTPTSTNDIVLGAYSISSEVCKAINKKLTGSDTIPTLTANSTRIYITDFANNYLTNVQCPGCDGKPALCFANSGGGLPAFYSILEAR